MISACHSCPFDDLGRRLSAVAAAAERENEPLAAHACRSVADGFLSRHCVSCKRTTQDDLRISNSPHAIAETVASVAPATAATTPPTVTTLPAETEDRLLSAFAQLFALSPIQFLLLRHVMRGGRLCDFDDALQKVRRKIASYHGTSRARAWSMRNAVVAAVPFLAPLLSAENMANGRH